MPALAEFPKPTSAFEYRSNGAEWSLQSEGPEGRQLRREYGEAIQHWIEPAEISMASRMQDPRRYPSKKEYDDEFLSNTAVPPKQTFYVKTRYVFLGRGNPLSFVLDDD